MSSTPILDKINGPDDLKKLELSELEQLSAELRATVVDTVAQNGGHLSSNLGVTELTIALHRVFSSPKDRILWDVGHQSYIHKLLTGRREKFNTLRKFGGLSGFCRPDESPCDAFISGHAGSAISAAMGFSVSDQLNGSEDHVIAVVGDGCLINGISLEALNNLRSTCKRLILVVNDNEMSIAKSVGAIPHYLNSLITGRNYNRFKAFAKMVLHKIPGGNTVVSGVQQLEVTAKNIFVPGILFEELGIRYVGPINGHDIPTLIRTLEGVRDFNHPVLIHVITEKGHGFEYAREAPERFHGIGAFDPTTGKTLSQSGRHTFSKAFGAALMKYAEQDERILAITPAMASGCGIPPEFAERWPNRFFDVGIAEEHALTFAAGLAAGGKRPIVAIYATFLQRALDCLFHDICLQDLPVTLCIDRAGAVEDGPTHHGIYDLSFLMAMPNLAILLPECEKTLDSMMGLALLQNHPVAIRYPRGGSPAKDSDEPASIEWGKAVCARAGKDLAIWGAGREYYTALAAAEILENQYGISAAVWNVRFLKPFDEAAFLATAQAMPVATIEDHSLRGGLGDYAASLLADHPGRGLFRFGWNADTILPHGATDDLRRSAGLLPDQIAASLAEKLKRTKTS